LIQVVIYLIVFGVIWWAVTEVLKILPLDERIKTVINVLLIVILVLVLVFYVLMPLLGHMPRMR
jgi:hypothetical protein